MTWTFSHEDLMTYESLDFAKTKRPSIRVVRDETPKPVKPFPNDPKKPNWCRINPMTGGFR